MGISYSSEIVATSNSEIIASAPETPLNNSETPAELPLNNLETPLNNDVIYIFSTKELKKFFVEIQKRIGASLNENDVDDFLDQTAYSSNYFFQYNNNYFSEQSRVIIDHCDEYFRSMTKFRHHFQIINLCKCSELGLTKTQMDLLTNLMMYIDVKIAPLHTCLKDSIQIHPMLKYKSE